MKSETAGQREPPEEQRFNRATLASGILISALIATLVWAFSGGIQFIVVEAPGLFQSHFSWRPCVTAWLVFAVATLAYGTYMPTRSSAHFGTRRSLAIFLSFVIIATAVGGSLAIWSRFASERQKARETTALQKTRTVLRYIRNFASDHNGRLPNSIKDLAESIPLINSEVQFRDPYSGRQLELEFFPRKEISAFDVILIASPTLGNGQRLVGMQSGKVQSIAEDYFQRLLAEGNSQ